MHSESPFYYPLQEDDESHDQPLNAHLKAALCGVKSTARCPDCGQPNVVVTLGVAPDRFDLPCPEFKFFTLFGITELPSTVLAMLKRLNPHFGLCFDGLRQKLGYLNSCAACERVFEDEDLRFEPGDAFYPLEAADYERMRIVDLGLDITYRLRNDEDEERSIPEIVVGCWNPAPEIWETLVEPQEA